jgi:hypothetical protein
MYRIALQEPKKSGEAVNARGLIASFRTML